MIPGFSTLLTVGPFGNHFLLRCFLNTEGTNAESYLSICPEVPKDSMPPSLFLS